MSKRQHAPDLRLTRPQADFISCLMSAVIAALPSFLEAFMGCLAGPGPSPGDDDYDPGTRNRCD